MSVLEKATHVIDCLGHAGEPVTLGHVRAQLGMPKSSTHRLLAELVSLGIVRRDGDGRYSLGPRLLYWGEAAADSFDLRVIAEQSMRRLRDEIGESVHLYVRDGDVRVCIAAVEARHELRPFVALGRPLPLTRGAAGKLLLAFCDDDDVERRLLRRADTSGRTAELDDELGRIRDEHWATSVGEREEGVSAAATSIRDSQGRVVAALAISGPSTRLGLDHLEDLRPALQACAHEISVLVGAGE